MEIIYNEQNTNVEQKDLSNQLLIGSNPRDPASSLESNVTLEEKQNLGDRMKSYEKQYTKIIAEQNLPLIVRLDGKNFSVFTRNLNRDVKPFSSNFANIMKDTASYMMHSFNSNVCFTVSDEITLIFINKSERSLHPFAGKIYKIQSLMAAAASTYFVSKLTTYLPEKVGNLPIFDCRAFTVPNIMEAYNSVYWRYRDGFKNAVSTVARLYYSKNHLFKKHTKEQLNMLEKKGINFEESYLSMYKYGTCLAKIKKIITFLPEELSMLPEKHNARTNGGGTYHRNVIEEIQISNLYNYLTTCNN